MLEFEYYFGLEILPFVETVSQMRIQEFRNYPYLYLGSLEYEANYLRGFATDPKSCLAVARQDGEIIGVVTAMPLKSEADILKDAERLFAKAGERIELFYYLGEFIVLPKYRRFGISKRIEQELEVIARSFGFSRLCLSTVIRNENDSRRPKEYKENDVVWNKMGFRPLNLEMNYHWPTIQADGSVIDIVNTMKFWGKLI